MNSTNHFLNMCVNISEKNRFHDFSKQLCDLTKFFDFCQTHKAGSAKRSQQELHPKFFKPFGYCCSLLWSSNSSSMSSPSITCHVSWSNNHIVWLWTLCMENNTFVAVSSISRFQWPFEINFVQCKYCLSQVCPNLFSEFAE